MCINAIIEDVHVYRGGHAIIRRDPIEIAGEVEEAGLDLLFGDDTDDHDEDDWVDDDEWLMALVTPTRATPYLDMTHGTSMPPSVTKGLCVRMGNLEYGHRALVKKMGTAVQMTSLHGAELQNQQLRTRLAKMESCEGTLMSYLLWMKERLAVLEKKLPRPPPGPL
nr:hypothetical protein [Tanacetum cinerariifolium]